MSSTHSPSRLCTDTPARSSLFESPSTTSRPPTSYAFPPVFCALTSDFPNYPPYRIENCTRFKLTVHQRGCKQTLLIRSYESAQYTWSRPTHCRDEPTKLHRLVVRLDNSDVEAEFGLDKVKKHRTHLYLH